MRITDRLALLALALGASACAPVFSELQSAKLLDKGRVEVTPSFSHVGLSVPDEDEGHVQDELGVQLGVGLADAVELRGRFAHVEVDGDGPSVEVFGVGPKVRLVKDRLALYVPIGRAFADVEDADFGESWQVHPTLLFTGPVNRHLEVNASAKYLIPLNSGESDNLVAFNLGLGLGRDVNTLALRPEVGLLLNPGEEGHWYHFSLGLSYRP
jgi:hypothetical protein